MRERRQLATFNIGSQLFAVDILLVREIGLLEQVTPVPAMGRHFRGLMNLRGQIVSVIDPVLFVEDRGIPPNGEKVLIFKNDEQLQPLVERGLVPKLRVGADHVGLAIDAADEVVDVTEPGQVVAVPAHLPECIARMASGVLMVGEALAVVLDYERFLKAASTAALQT